MSEATPKTIAITGVSRGLGRALVDRFVEAGHQVAGCARSAESIEQLRAQYPDQHFRVVNVADDAEVASWTAEALEHFGAPDLLLNNAAIMNRNAMLWSVPPEEFDRLCDVNIKGVYYVLRHFTPAMIQNGTGVIVNFSSGWGRSTSPEVAPYCASKWAIEGMTRALAQELPPGLAAIPLNPGVIHTKMLESCFGAGASAYPDADDWSRRAAPFLLALSPADNGDPLTAPS